MLKSNYKILLEIIKYLDNQEKEPMVLSEWEQIKEQDRKLLSKSMKRRDLIK